MPIVFVHGVNNRKTDSGYDLGVKEKEKFLRSVFAPRAGINSGSVSITFPYWGGHGVSFRWNHASVPSASDNEVALAIGSDQTELDLWLGEIRFQAKMDEVIFGEIARLSGFSAAVELIWDTAAATNPDDIEKIITYDEASQKYIESKPSLTWALSKPSLSNQEFINKLIQEIKLYLPSENGEVTLGLGGWIANLREAASRLANAPGDVVSSLITASAREATHKNVSRFLGDIFVYLSRRDQTGGDTILADLIDKLQTAHAKRSDDDKLIVIGHSLGGLLVYDVLTHYLPEIKVDHFITVGSQVAVFEEMTLCRISKNGIPVNPPKDKIKKPSNIDQWINVYDTNDVFSFKFGGVIEGVEDFKFDTGYGLLQSHTGYFSRLSFYKRLAERIKS